MRSAGLAWMLIALVLGTVSPAGAQAPDLATVVLTSADVPAGLRLNPDRSGPQMRGGTPGYQVTFEGDPLSIAQAGGGIVSVVNLVALPDNPATGLDELVRGMRQGLPGNTVDLTPPPIGEDSRAFTSSLGFGPLNVNIAGTAFRRGAVVAAVIVMGAGDQVPSEAVRLAQVVDGRLLRAGQP
jgi:hypothetical protein